MPSLTNTRYFLSAGTSLSSSSIFSPAIRPAWVFVPELISCWIAFLITSYSVSRSMKSVTFAFLLKITIPTFTLAPDSAISAFNSFSMFNACCSISALVDLSRTNTTSVTNCFSALGSDNVTVDSNLSPFFSS